MGIRTVSEISWLARAACPLCGSSQRMDLLDKEGGHYVQCSDCRLVYTSPAQSDEHLKQIAEEWAVKHQASAEKTVWEGNPAVQQLIYGPRVSALERYRKNGRILDIGCSTGDFLAYAQDQGWQVYGSELAQHTSNIARQNLQAEVRSGSFETSGFEAAFFDVVTMWDVIEHVLDPQKFLQEAFRILRPGGALVLYTPNYDSLTRYLIFDRWRALIPDRHLCVFNRHTIRRIIEQSGGSVRSIRSMDINPYEILYGERKETMQGLKGRQQAMSGIKRLLVKYPVLQVLRNLINVLLRLTHKGDVLEVYAVRD